MKITLKLLEQFHACEDGMNFMRDNYPEGEEALKIIQDNKATMEMLHFAYRYFSLDKEEIDMYRQICNIDSKSRFCWYSQDIENSTGIDNSTNVQNSQFVQDSSAIYNSSNITNGQLISNSHDIYDAKSIRNSVLVVHSNDILESNEIQFSSHIKWSRFITNSNFIEDCAYIYKSEYLTDCYCSGFLINCKHCLFCSDLKDAEYYIFNEKVNPDTYEYWKENLMEQLGVENSHMIVLNTKTHNISERYLITTRFDCVFDGLSEMFYGWVGTVPGSTDLKFISLFFRDV